MTARAVLCILFRHRWAPAEAPAGSEGVPGILVRCKRCGQTSLRSPETRGGLTYAQKVGAIDYFGNKLP